MSEALGSWWLARTPRERLLISVTLWLAFVVAIPLALWQAASTYRHDAGVALTRAETMRDLVGRIDPVLIGAPVPVGATVQEIAATEATALGLRFAQVTASGPDKISLTFAPGDSLAILTWIDHVSRAGLSVERTSLVRMDEAGVVQADIELSRGGS